MKLSREARAHVEALRLWLTINGIPGLLIPADPKQEPMAMHEVVVRHQAQVTPPAMIAEPEEVTE